MSFQSMSWATDQELPAMQKIVLLMMANRTNHDTGLCFPSHERLAKECGMSKRSLIDQINKLEESGLVEVIRSVNESGIKNVNRYRLMLNVSAKNNSANPAPVVQEMHGGSATDALGVVQDVHYGSAGAAHKPVIEPVTIKPIKEPKDIASPVFKKPSHAEIQTYCLEAGLKVDADEVIDYYNSNGWMVGKSKMKDWKAAVRNWARNAIKFKSNKQNNYRNGSNGIISNEVWNSTDF